MARRKSRASARRAPLTAALGLAAALTAVLAAGCSAAPAHSGPGPGGAAAGTPALTAAQARQVFVTYVTAAAKATSPASAAPLLALVTGTEQAVLGAALSSHSVVSSGGTGAGSAYSSTLRVQPALAAYAYGSPAFYLPEASGYPRFFVTSVTRTLRGTAGAAAATTEIGDAKVPANGPVLMLFSQARSDKPWLLASVSQLPTGVTVPALATGSSGHTPTVPLTDPSLLAQPGDAGPLQAAVVDDGQQSPATRVVAAGPLTTGMYQGAATHADGTTTPPGDAYQWELEGVTSPGFALRTAAGGALVFYTMTLNATVAVPGVLAKANPITPGPKIPVPLALQMLLPKNQPAPQTQLQSQQTLSFAAVDPPQGTAKLEVLAIGGGLTSASAS